MYMRPSFIAQLTNKCFVNGAGVQPHVGRGGQRLLHRQHARWAHLSPHPLPLAIQVFCTLIFDNDLIIISSTVQARRWRLLWLRRPRRSCVSTSWTGSILRASVRVPMPSHLPALLSRLCSSTRPCPCDGTRTPRARWLVHPSETCALWEASEAARWVSLSLGRSSELSVGSSLIPWVCDGQTKLGLPPDNYQGFGRLKLDEVRLPIVSKHRTPSCILLSINRILTA
jgi:hypothetical protein